MGYSSVCARARCGRIFLVVMVRIRRAYTGSTGGTRRVGDRILEGVPKAYDGDIQMIDSSSNRVHQHAANGKKTAIPLHGSLTERPDDQDPCPCRWMRPAHRAEAHRSQANDSRSADVMLESLTVGTILLGDRAYDSNKLLKTLAARGAWANVKPIPQRRNPKNSENGATENTISLRGSPTNSNTSEPSPPLQQTR